MAYDAKAVANMFLDLAAKDGTKLTPMKLQKLVFYAHGWNLGLRGEPLIADEVQAWQYGPVVPALYHEFKRYGSGAITEHATEFNLDDFEFVAPSIPKTDTKSRELISRIWDVYGKFSGIQLSELTHQEGTPWSTTLREAEDVRNAVIPPEVMRTYFAARIAKKDASRE